ncbi:MAG: coenzyme F420-0:L-glutamate ligase [Candidatus Methanospirareceae archaeon]
MEIIPVRGIPEIKEGDDLVKIFFEGLKATGVTLEDDDIIVFASKIVAKSEGRVVELSSVVPSEEAKKIARELGKDARVVQLILEETREIVKIRRGIIITETKSGHICANAGVDESNVEEGKAILLPKDAQRSAVKLREGIERESGKRVSVLVADSCGRPFRAGVVGTCIGVSGMRPLLDRRGEEDRFGKILRITKVAVADEICAAANLIMGEAKEGIPIVIVRGLRLRSKGEEGDIKEIFFSKEEDIFR